MYARCFERESLFSANLTAWFTFFKEQRVQGDIVTKSGFLKVAISEKLCKIYSRLVRLSVDKEDPCHLTNVLIWLNSRYVREEKNAHFPRDYFKLFAQLGRNAIFSYFAGDSFFLFLQYYFYDFCDFNICRLLMWSRQHVVNSN